MDARTTNQLTWKKSSRSGGRLDCVEIAHTPSSVAIRDSKDPHGPTLHVTPTAFHYFLNTLNNTTPPA
jgi:hypothetical protein